MLLKQKQLQKRKLRDEIKVNFAPLHLNWLQLDQSRSRL